MLASVLIITFSFVLFVYWFRYSCILVLRSHAEQPLPVPPERFSYPLVQRGLQAGMDLDPLHLSLERDYRVLTYLMEHAAGLKLEQVEYRLLVLDYKMMRGWYRLTKSKAPKQARRALAEMAAVLSVLVGEIGPPSGAHNEA